MTVEMLLEILRDLPLEAEVVVLTDRGEAEPTIGFQAGRLILDVG